MLASNQGSVSEVSARDERTGVRALAVAKTKVFLILSEQRLEKKTLAIGTFGETPGELCFTATTVTVKSFCYGQSGWRKTFDAIFKAQFFHRNCAQLECWGTQYRLFLFDLCQSLNP